MILNEFFGFIGLFFLLLAMSQKSFLKLRIILIMANLMYLMQGFTLDSYSLIIGSILSISINIFMMIKKYVSVKKTC